MVKPVSVERFLEAIRCFPQLGLSIVKIASAKAKARKSCYTMSFIASLYAVEVCVVFEFAGTGDPESPVR